MYVYTYVFKTNIFCHTFSQGYEISAVSNVFFDRLQAEEFLEVYKDVVPDYVDHVLQLSNGPSIALEVSHVGDVCMYDIVCVYYLMVIIYTFIHAYVRTYIHKHVQLL